MKCAESATSSASGNVHSHAILFSTETPTSGAVETSASSAAKFNVKSLFQGENFVTMSATSSSSTRTLPAPPLHLSSSIRGYQGAHSQHAFYTPQKATQVGSQWSPYVRVSVCSEYSSYLADDGCAYSLTTAARCTQGSSTTHLRGGRSQLCRGQYTQSLRKICSCRLRSDSSYGRDLSTCQQRLPRPRMLTRL